MFIDHWWSNLFFRPIASFGQTIAHEIGHNLGMVHDFEEVHGGSGVSGSGGPCDGGGLMSYDEFPNKWSKCSVKDFKGHYTKMLKENGKWCLPGD